MPGGRCCPTAEQADIVLPGTGAFEAEGLNVGFEVSQEAQSLVQLRAPLVPPVGEARSDIEVIFDLAARLGLGEHFFGGDVDAGWAFQLEPSGVTLRQLRDDPAGIRLPLETRHCKYAAVGDDRVPAAFATPTGRIELHPDTAAERGIDGVVLGPVQRALEAHARVEDHPAVVGGDQVAVAEAGGEPHAVTHVDRGASVAGAMASGRSR